MAYKIFPRIEETSTTTGTGNITVSGATTGNQAFSARYSVGDTFPGYIEAIDGSGNLTGEWETGLYTYSATNTITRTAVVYSSNADALVSFSSGSKRVFVDIDAADYSNVRNSPSLGQLIAASLLPVFL